MLRTWHILGLLVLLNPLRVSPELKLSDVEAKQLGERIWINETGGNDDRLLWWNEGEQFASLGIGHFIWFPAHSEAPFEQSFPGLLTFMQGQGVLLPEWLRGNPPPPCPWPDRSVFMTAKEEPRMQQLRDLLKATFAQQARFMAARAEQALPRMTAVLPANERPGISARFSKLAGSPEGLYALVDYVNFKGYGTSPKERYQGQGWGLLQVLQTMEDDASRPSANAFADAAEAVLRQRVRNAPAIRNEQRWLRGWLKRVATYRTHKPST